MPFYVDGTSNNITTLCSTVIAVLLFCGLLGGCVYGALQLTLISGTPSTTIRAHNTTELEKQLKARIEFPEATATNDILGKIDSKRFHSFSIAILNTTLNICKHYQRFVVPDITCTFDDGFK